MAERDENYRNLAFPKPTVLVQSFDLNTGKCSLEGVRGRRKTCPNNPVRNPDVTHLPEICAACPTNYSLADSTEKVLPPVYAPLRQQQHNPK